MSFFATSEREKERLQYFASPEGREHLYQYNQKESRAVLEVRKFALKLFITTFFPRWLVMQNNFGSKYTHFSLQLISMVQ